MSWDLRALGGAVQLPCGELAWTKPQIFRVLASVEAMRGVVLGGDVLFGNGTYTGSSPSLPPTTSSHSERIKSAFRESGLSSSE